MNVHVPVVGIVSSNSILLSCPENTRVLYYCIHTHACMDAHTHTHRHTHTQRYKHAWTMQSMKSSKYALMKEEKVKAGPRTDLEYLLVGQILRHCQHLDTDLDTVHKIYSSCLELMQGIQQKLHFLLGQKHLKILKKL